MASIDYGRAGSWRFFDDVTPAFSRWRSLLVSVSVVLVLSSAIAVTVVGGRNRALLGLVGLSALVILSEAGRKWRFRALVLAVLASPLLVSSLPSIGAPLELSQIVLLLVVMVELAVVFESRRAESAVSALGSRYYLPFALFALLGLASAYFNGELGTHYWPATCLTPLLLLFAADRLVESVGDVVRLLQAALVAIIAFAAIVWVAQKTGQAHLMPQYGNAWRFGDSLSISMGPLSFDVFSIRLGSLAALGVPAAFVLAGRSRRVSERGAYLAIMLTLVVVLAFTVARGAIIGAAFGLLVAAVVSRRFWSPRVILSLVVLVVFLALAGFLLLEYLPSQNRAYFAELASGPTSLGTFNYRVGVWGVTIRGILAAPLGPGYEYLWYHYGLDECVAYSVILNGTGVFGFLAFGAMLLALVLGYVSRAGRTADADTRDLAAVGLGTMAAALLAGVASQSVFVEPVQSFVLWSILGATIVGIVKLGSRADEAVGTKTSPACLAQRGTQSTPRPREQPRPEENDADNA